MTIKEVKVLSHQREFIESEALSTCIIAGYGAGKSAAGTLKTIIKKLQYPNIKVAYYLPNYPLISDIAFSKFPDMCNQLDLHYQLNKTAKELEIYGFGKIIFRNLSEPEKIVGYDVGYSCIDEIDTLPKAKAKDAYQKILARSRTPLPDGKPNTLDMVSTPEGFRFLYAMFVTNKNANQKLIKARTADNPYLPAGYIDTLKENYDPQLLKQYLEGEFVNVNSSNIYHQFDRQLHVIEDTEIDTTKPLIITFDFNIQPYNAIFLIQVIDGKVIVIDNAIKKNSCLIDSLAYLKKKFKYLGSYLFGATIYGDASGKARSQGTAQTNYDLIRDAGWNNQLIKAANPRVQDRINVVNSLFKNGKDETKLFVCKKNTELINDFEMMSYNAKGEIDKSDLEISHASDSVGYYLEHNFNIIEQKELRVSYGATSKYNRYA